jgi:tRNA-2-methylthio-N6-dimethylallyladenosine synthase
LSITVPESALKEQRFFIQKTKAMTHAMPSPPLAYVHSYGCQQNVSDGEKIKGMLAEMGFGFTQSADRADLILFNTCAVRENAEERVFGNVGALKNHKKRNPNLIVALCGCMVQQEHITNKLKKSYPFVDLIFGPHALHKFPQMLFETLADGKRRVDIEDSDGVIAEGLPIVRESGVRASVPIMYGCNNFCSYCVVPLVRGRERSRELSAVLEECDTLIKAGYKEILLLGQNVNSYGKQQGTTFSQLLREIAKIDGEFKISFMTSHPKDCTYELIDTIAENEKISRRLHLPVQSGSNRILSLMNRHYTVETYLDLVTYAKRKIPDLSLTTDIIVGFPGETYDDFKETLSLVKKVGYDTAYTFLYSKREGTKAASMDDPVSEEEKGIWFRELLDVLEQTGLEKYKSFIGKTMRVLVEGESRSKPGHLSAKTMQDITVDILGNTSLVGTFQNVKITNIRKTYLEGEIISL